MDDIDYRVIYKYLKDQKIFIDKDVLKESVLTHQDYPSLQTIADILGDRGIKSMGVSLTREDLNQVQFPVIGHFVKEGEGSFFLIESVDNESVTVFTGKKKEVISIPGFASRWSGACLLLDANDSKPIDKKISGFERVKRKFDSVMLSSLLIFFLSILWRGLSLYGLSFQTTLVPVLSLFGLLVSCRLLRNEHSDAEDRYCRKSKQRSCKDVLSSRYSMLFGAIKWSEMGVFYFLTLIILYVMAFCVQRVSAVFDLLGVLSGIGVLGSIYSFYVQGVILKKWCVLCVFCQLIIVTNTMVFAFWGNKMTQIEINLSDFNWVLFCVLISGLITRNIVKRYRYSVDIIGLKKNLSKWNKDKKIFSMLQAGEKGYSDLSNVPNIQLSKGDGINEVLMIGSPFCKHCFDLYKKLKKLNKKMNSSLSLKVMTIANSKTEQVFLDHLLSLIASADANYTREAFDKWYSNPDGEKTLSSEFIDDWKRLFPTINNVDSDSELLLRRALDSWVISNDVTATPTLYVNGKLLNSKYRVDDLFSHFK